MRPSTSLLRELVRKRDFYAGGLMLLLGLFIGLKGLTYRTGSLMHMGPGFFPTALGFLLVLIGIAIAAASFAPSEDGSHDGDERILPADPQWFAWLCILAGPGLFIVFGYFFGMAPGTFACIFIAALGDRKATLLGTLILSTVVTVFGVFLFSYFLQVPMPIITGYWGLAFVPFLCGLAGAMLAQRQNADQRKWFAAGFFMPMISPIPFLLGWIGATLARRKNRDEDLWFGVCLILPVIGLLLIAILPKRHALASARPVGEPAG